MGKRKNKNILDCGGRTTELRKNKKKLRRRKDHMVLRIRMKSRLK